MPAIQNGERDDFLDSFTLITLYCSFQASHKLVSALDEKVKASGFLSSVLEPRHDWSTEWYHGMVSEILN